MEHLPKPSVLLDYSLDCVPDALNIQQYVEISTTIEISSARMLDAIATGGRKCRVPIFPVIEGGAADGGWDVDLFSFRDSERFRWEICRRPLHAKQQLPVLPSDQCKEVVKETYEWRAKNKKWRAPKCRGGRRKELFENAGGGGSGGSGRLLNRHAQHVLDRLETARGEHLFGPIHDPLESFSLKSATSKCGGTTEHYQRFSYKWVPDPELTASLPSRLFLAMYVKALLVPPSETLESLSTYPLPQSPSCPNFLSWKTRGIVEALGSDDSRAKPARFDLSKLLGKHLNRDLGDVGDGFVEGQVRASAYSLLPNATPVGRFFSTCAMGLFTQKTLQNTCSKWLEVVAKVRQESERSRWTVEATLDGVDGRGAGGFEGFGIVGQKLHVLAMVTEDAQSGKGRTKSLSQDSANMKEMEVGLSDAEDEEEEGECDENDDNEIFHDSLSSPPPLRRSSTAVPPFARCRPPPQTIDVKLERKIMCDLASSSPTQATTLFNSFHLTMIKSDIASCKHAHPAIKFEDFKEWLERHYDIPYDASKLAGLFESTQPCAPDLQPLPYDPAVESEKILHFLQFIPPYTLFNQLISTSFANALYVLNNIEHIEERNCFNGKVERVRLELAKQLDKACELLKREVEEGECVTQIREEFLIDQEILLTLDRSCDMIERAELFLSRTLSLGNKTGRYDLVDFDFENFSCKGTSGVVEEESCSEQNSLKTEVMDFLSDEIGGGKVAPQETEMFTYNVNQSGVAAREVLGRFYAKKRQGLQGEMFSIVCGGSEPSGG